MKNELSGGHPVWWPVGEHTKGEHTREDSFYMWMAGKATRGLDGVDHNICMVLYNTKSILQMHYPCYRHSNPVEKVYTTNIKNKFIVEN